MRKAQIASVLALAILGLVGACLILSQEGFTTSSKRGTWQVFVPAPQAYVMAAIMFALSILATVWVLREIRATRLVCFLGAVAYCGIALGLIQILASYLR